MTQARRMQVLRAVVEDYIHTQEPVGSATLIERHDFGVSSATIRKDMSALEQEGYLDQPHTSAGRIPTESAYRYFVDTLGGNESLRATGNATLPRLLDGAVSLQDALQRAARAISHCTGQVAVVTAPALSRSRLRHLELITASSHAVLAVVVTDTGRVAQHIISMPSLPQSDELATLCSAINTRCATMTLHDTAEAIRAVPLHDSDLAQFVSILSGAFEDLADEEHAYDLFMSGMSSLARQRSSAADLAPLFDTLEERGALAHLMSAVSAASSRSGDVGVAIGSETKTPGLLHAAVISTGYGSTMDGDGPIAFVGSIGPTHMDYAVAMASVRAVARYLTSFLSHGQDDPD